MDDSLNHDIATEADVLVFQPRRALASLPGWARVHLAELLSAVLLTAMCLQMLSVIARKSVTVDEIILIPAAYYHLVTEDVDLVREHPPLCKLLAGMPLLFIQPNEAARSPTDPPLSRIDLEWKYEMEFWQNNRARADTISFWARVPMIVLTFALGLLIFVFSRDVFGSRAALLAVALFTLEPTVLAHGRVVQTDIPATFGFLFTALALHRYLHARTWKLAISVGAAAGVAMLAKFSMIIVGPILCVVFLVLLWREPRRRGILVGQAIAAALVLIVVINAAYFFHDSAFTETDVQWIRTYFPASSVAVLTSIRVLKFLLPTDFLMGVYWQLNHSIEGHPASLLGMYSRTGWWYYYPVAFALKTTIPFLLVSLSSLAWGLYRFIWKRELPLLVLLIPFLLYTALMMMSRIDIGIRYYLPAYAFLFILSGGLLDSLLRKRFQNLTRFASASVVVIAFAWISFEALRAYPNHIPYMNQLASSRPHWWYLSDSNVEWGDDIKELGAYLRSRGEKRVRAMALGDFSTLGLYGVEHEWALTPPQGPTPRYMALGASFLNGSTVPSYEIDGKRVSEEQRVNTLDSFRHRTPEAVIGNSIYLYRMHE
ncbi:MAG: ArnT family glycosyltransferase [Pyrinomonadaceae bacterium]